MPRMQILTPAEYAAFETPPQFNRVERKRFFDLSQSLESLLSPFEPRPIRLALCWHSAISKRPNDSLPGNLTTLMPPMWPSRWGFYPASLT